MSACLDENTALELIDARLSSAARTAVERHLEGCDACRELVAELAKADDDVAIENDAKATRGREDRGADTERNPASDGDHASTLPPGAHAGPYRIERPIGSGSAGIVYRAIDERTNEVVALKYVTDRGLRARFAREAETLARLDHDAIVRYIGHGETPGGMYLAMEWLEGEDLEQRFRRSGAIGWEGARTLGLRLSAALAHAHTLGCVHRDLSPRNIYLPEARLERAKLLDFGLVRLNLTGELARTATHAVLGTPFYMSPEQVKDPKSVTARSDLFGIGVLMYEAISGIRPFHGDDLFTVWVKIVDLPAPDLRGLVASPVPEALILLVEALLAKDPADRPASAAEVNERLLALSLVGPISTAVMKPLAPPAPVVAYPPPVMLSSGPPSPHGAAGSSSPLAPTATAPPIAIGPPNGWALGTPSPASVPVRAASTAPPTENRSNAILVAVGVVGVTAVVATGVVGYQLIRKPSTGSVTPNGSAVPNVDEKPEEDSKGAGSKPPEKHFPLACADNEQVRVTGDWTGSGPLVTSVGDNCRIQISNAKLKGSILFRSSASNVELTLENVTLETTDIGAAAGGNFKVKIVGSTLRSTGNTLGGGTNFETDAIDTTIESKEHLAFSAEGGMNLRATNAKIRGKEGAIDAQGGGLDLRMKKATEITSTGGPAIYGGANTKIDADGGKIEGPTAIRGPQNLGITSQRLVVSGTKGPAVVAGNGAALTFTEGSITASGEVFAFDAAADLTLVGGRVEGGAGAVSGGTNLHVIATKKARIVARAGSAIASGINLEVRLDDATVEAPELAIKGGTNAKIRLARGAKITGKKGAISGEANFEIDATGATVDGGAGPGLSAFLGARVVFREGTLKGIPAFVFDRPPLVLDLAGTRIEGEQQKTRGH